MADGPFEAGVLNLQNLMPYAALHLAVVALGIARDAIESFKELAQRKTPARGTTTLARQRTVHERVGRAEALLQSARAYLYAVASELPAHAAWTREIDDELSARLRLASTRAAHAVDLMFTSGGTTAVFAQSRLDRCFRDVHMVTQHIGIAASNIEMVGQYYLGLGLHARR